MAPGVQFPGSAGDLHTPRPCPPATSPPGIFCLQGPETTQAADL